MNKNSVLVDGVRVIGATLWSNCSKDTEQHVQRGLNDYYHITVEEDGKKRKLLVSDTNAFHEDEKTYIANEIKLAKENKEKVVVLTHHSPILDGSDPKYDNDALQGGFCSNLENIMGDPVILWLFGHTHYQKDVLRNKTRVITNATGYPMENSKWIRKLAITVDDFFTRNDLIKF